jgi:hypothetical protein
MIYKSLICFRGVKLFLLKYVPTATVATVNITTVNITTVTITTVTINLTLKLSQNLSHKI